MVCYDLVFVDQNPISFQASSYTTLELFDSVSHFGSNLIDEHANGHHVAADLLKDP